MRIDGLHQVLTFNVEDFAGLDGEEWRLSSGGPQASVEAPGIEEWPGPGIARYSSANRGIGRDGA
jgi:hypothetical protein